MPASFSVRVGVSACLLALGACTLGPDFQRPASTPAIASLATASGQGPRTAPAGIERGAAGSGRLRCGRDARVADGRSGARLPGAARRAERPAPGPFEQRDRRAKPARGRAPPQPGRGHRVRHLGCACPAGQLRGGHSRARGARRRPRQCIGAAAGETAAQIGAAQADFYPSISLTGSLGVQDLSFSDLGDWGARQFAIGPTLHLPLFEGGRLKGNLALTEARRQYFLFADCTG